MIRGQKILSHCLVFLPRSFCQNDLSYCAFCAFTLKNVPRLGLTR